MKNDPTETFRSYLVPVATLGMALFYWLVASGIASSVTANDIWVKYESVITPADWGFTIRTLIYVWLFAFSVYQLFHIERFRGIRSFYILACLLDSAWGFCWLREMIVVNFVLIVAEVIVLAIIAGKVKWFSGLAENWLVHAPLGLFFGWVTATALMNFAAMMTALERPIGVTAGVILLALGAVAAVLARWKFLNFFFPLSIAWMATAVGVKHSSQMAVVTTSALTLVAGLVTAGSVVTMLQDSSEGQTHLR